MESMSIIGTKFGMFCIYNEILSWMIRVLMENHLVSDETCSIGIYNVHILFPPKNVPSTINIVHIHVDKFTMLIRVCRL